MTDSVRTTGGSTEVLAGRTALVTGASGGIGGAIARRLAHAGTDVALTYAGHADDAETTAEACRAAGVRTLVLPADFSVPATPADLVERVTSELGPVDVLVPAAGVGRPAAWDAVDDDLWETTWRVNTTAPFRLTQLVTGGMVRRHFGRILFISSIAALNGGVIGPHYAASKAALHGLVHNLAPALAPDGVTVNALAPALITGTRILPTDPDDEDAMPLPVPVGRLGTTNEVADLALAMLANSYLTNKVVPLDGGLLPY